MKTFVIVLFCFLTLSVKRGSLYDEDKVCLTAEEQKLYDLVMAYRKSKRLESIPISSKLTQVAHAHVRDLEENYEFKPDNKCNPHSWSKHGQWSSCCYTSDHKVASCMWDKPKEIANYEGPGFEIAYYSSIQAQALEAITGWKKSSAHNPLLINSGQWSKVKWNAIGIGIYGSYGVIWFGELKDDAKPSDCAQ